METQRSLPGLLRALLGAKKSFALYPPGSRMTTIWVRRLGATLGEHFRDGQALAIRIGRDRFLGLGEELPTADPALEAFRSGLEMQGIGEIGIEPSVEDWELQALLELLNRPAETLESLTGAAGYLRDRHVIHVSIGMSGIGGAGHARGAGGTAGSAGAGPAGLHARQDVLDLLVEAVLEAVDERFGDLAYDRAGLLEWFRAISAHDRLDVLSAGIAMLGALAEGRGDREVRTRTMLEAILLLPERTLRPLLGDWLLPLAGSDLVAFNLLTHVTEDELAEIARLVPTGRLMALTTELLEFPWEEGKRRRLVENITALLKLREAPGTAPPPVPLLSRDDPVLVALRQEILDACQPDALLERSADVLLALLSVQDHEEYPDFALDALEDIVSETLARGRAPLALRILRQVDVEAARGGEPSPEHAEGIRLLRKKLASRPHVSLAAGLLRQDLGGEQVGVVATYLQLVAAEALQEFLELLAEERDRRVRLRMCQVLVHLGPPVLPLLVSRLDGPRWFLTRNVLYVLGKMGSAAPLAAVIRALEHHHPRVRIEAARAAALIAGPNAVGPLLGRLTDPDPEFRRTVIRWLGTLKGDAAVGKLRALLTAPAATEEDWELKREAAHALSTIGTPTALAALEAIAGHRSRFWQRADRRISDMAAEALEGQRAAPGAEARSKDAD